MAKVLLNLAKVSAVLGGRIIFEEVSLELQKNQRIGLVGPNGAGKSTLMKMMVQEIDPNNGEIFRSSGLTCARLEQEPVMAGDRNVLAEALTAVPEIGRIRERLDNIEVQMADPAVYEDFTKLEKVLDKHTGLLEEYERLGGRRYQSQVKAALSSTGLGQEIWDTPIRVLSGGQKKLVLLAKLLVQAPDLLLLDEPDNHLDVPAKRALEKVLLAYEGCVVIISHDRYLLDEVASHIAELENGSLTLYHGNYTAYTTERELRRLRQQQLYAAQQKEIARIEAAIARFEFWASQVVDVRHIRQARSRRKMLDKMDKVDKVVESRRMKMDLEGWRGSNKVLELENLGLILPNGLELWKGIDQIIWHGERVGLVGPNGAGKSMLMRQLLDPEAVQQGRIKIGPSISVGYYAQEHETLEMSETPIHLLRSTIPISENAAVSFLNRFLFSYDQVRGLISELSGGERSRLQLAKLVAARPNLLLLDEPTNNLDITSIEVLEETLDEFVGTLLVISHDRYFLDKVVDRIIELRDGYLSEFVGGYTDYLAEKKDLTS